MSLAHPIEIPELLHIIASHLSVLDHKSCLLVSKTWHDLFQTHSWNHLIYSRQGNPFLEKYGHLVRVVSTYGVSDRDMYIIATNCPSARRIVLSMNGTATWRGLEFLATTLEREVRELVVKLNHATPRFLLCIAHLKQLQVLELSVNPDTNRECNLKMLLGVLSECQSLVSLKVSWLIDNTITLPTNVKPPPPPNAQEDAVMAMAQSFPPRPKPPTPTSLFARIKKTLKLAPTGPRPGSNGVPSPFSTVRPDRPSADLHGREPWRKFVVYPTTATTTSQETDADNPNLFTEAEDLILRRSTISLNPYPFLRRIHLSKIATSTTTALDNTPTGQEILFRNSPCLEDLTWNCGYILPKQLLACLDAITDTCHFIKSLELISFCPISKNNDTLRRFFQHHRPELRTLKLQQCKGIEFAISLIPPATLAGLERVSFENTLYSHPILHKFMTHAKNLQHFTWKVGAEPQYHLMPHMQTPTALPENQRISAFLEPWACYGTMRHIEQSHAIVDQDSFEAFYQQRLTQMEQLVSLVVSIKDIRRSMETSKEGPSKSLNVEECGDAPQSHCAQPSSSIDRIQNLQQLNPSSTGSPQEKEHDKDSSQGKAERGLGWHFSTIQEVILDAIGINNVSYLPDTRQLALDEIKYLLAAFPKLRKILYRGRLYPLDNEARKFLEELESRRILVAHVAQIAPAL